MKTNPTDLCEASLQRIESKLKDMKITLLNLLQEDSTWTKTATGTKSTSAKGATSPNAIMQKSE